MEMKRIRTILYATDFSDSSIPACDYAFTLAKLAEARVHVLHVIEHLSAGQRALIQPEAYAEFEREVEIVAVKEMERFAREHFDASTETTTESAIGIPSREIPRKAAEIGADLIVMGTHGRTGIEQVFVGSTAERVVRSSAVAVLTVRGTE